MTTGAAIRLCTGVTGSQLAGSTQAWHLPQAQTGGSHCFVDGGNAPTFNHKDRVRSIVCG